MSATAYIIKHLLKLLTLNKTHYFTSCVQIQTLNVMFSYALIMLYRDGAEKIWPQHSMCTKRYVQNSVLDVFMGFDHPYLSFSIVFLRNNTVNVVREHC